jgi:tRNA A37 threonylcarbamoyladenosine dehydratase
MENRFERVERLFGEISKNFKDINILLFGVGGVGSFTLDCLYRTGFRKITIVDFDTYDESNLNRQLGSDNNIGRVKVDALKDNYPEVETINIRVTPQYIEEFDFTKFDLVLDAIDDVPSKVAIAKKVSKKLISSMGSAQQSLSFGIEVTSIWKTKNDGLAKAVRTSLKKENFRGDFKVIFNPQDRRGERKGSFVAVTGSFGLALCSEAVKRSEEILNDRV